MKPKPLTAEELRNNLGTYYLAQNPRYKWVRYQQLYVVPVLHRLANREIEALLIEAPPRSAKSDLGNHFQAWNFGRHPERSNMDLSYSDDLAKTFGRQIRNMVQTELHKTVFPGCRLSPGNRSATVFSTTAGGNYYALGFDASISGKGCTGVMRIDDPIKNMAEARSLTVQEHLIDTYRSTVRTRLQDEAVRLMVLTRWCRGDFRDRVLDEEGKFKEGGLWHVLTLPAQSYQENDPIHRPFGEYLWDARVKFYKENQRNEETWQALFQQNPKPRTGPWFSPDWLQFDTTIGTLKPGKFPCYLIIDPAKSGHVNQGDPSAMLVLAATPDRKLLLVDAVRDWLDPGERANAYLDLVKKWKPVRCVYEEYGLVSDTFYLREKMQKLGLFTYPIPVGRKGPRHNLTKEDRIFAIQSDFREGGIVLPPKLDKTMKDGNKIDLVDYFVNQEYLQYAGKDSVAHDDLLDAFSRIREPELNIVYPLKPGSEDDDLGDYIEAGSQGQTWESAL